MLHRINISLMPEDGASLDCPALLDMNMVTPFLNWLRANPTEAIRLKDGRWRIGVLEAHLENNPGWSKLRTLLEKENIEVIEYIFGRETTFLIMEIQRAYFGNSADSLASAQLLAYGRLSNSEVVRVISRHRCFHLVPNVQLYHIDNATEIGQEDNATVLRLLQALDLHDGVRRAAFQRILSHDYPVAIVETVKALFGEVRRIVEPAHSDLANLDGYQLIHQAFDGAPAKGKDPERTPKIQLNALVKDSEWSEQKGFRDIGCGAASAIRNPISHHEVEEAFIRERFGDRRTALKFLCMLSLLFEKLDKRVSP